MSEELKYITDATLAKLAKWLRLLGYDTIVYQWEAGREMLRLAEKEQRIVLTRRKDMLERQFSGRVYYIRTKDTGDQIREVVNAFSLPIDKHNLFTVCLICNERLQPMERKEVEDLVPAYVFANCTEYNKCPRCQRIYWAGTHQRNSLRFLERLSILSEGRI